ncbi:MAG: DMT family transporter [Hyphomicrobiales bacterium]|nr:DMT family transporter [Hyphomicrobiales bacterium]
MFISDNQRASVYMVLAMAALTLNDTIVKFASESINVGQVMFVRGLFATFMVLLLTWQQRLLRNIKGLLHPMVWVRMVGEIGCTVTYIIALAHLPLPNVAAIFQALPLAVTVGAALFFGESVGWRRSVAIAMGFCGTLIIVRPGTEGFNAFSLLVLLCVAFCTVRDLATRGIPNEVPTLLVSAVAALTITLCGALLIQPMGGWSPMEPKLAGLLLACASFMVVGYIFIIKAMRTGEISAVAPFRYTTLIWAFALGFLVFGNVPDLYMLLGGAIIAGSGLYTLYRERLVSKKRMAAESVAAPTMAPAARRRFRR